MTKQAFEKLEVWKISRELTKEIYGLTGDFPFEEKYGLTSQLRRACISISSNLAEGSSRITGKEQARFTEISYGSLMEVLNQLILSSDLGFITEAQVKEFRPKIDQLSRMLSRLRSSQLKNK